MSAVLVAHENETIRGVIEAVLRDAGYGVRCTGDGAACLAALDKGDVNALVLDVAIANPFAFELVHIAAERKPRVPVVLVASIYNRTSYKRRPTQLYGADDYIEQHHVPDALVEKVAALIGDRQKHAVEREAERGEVMRVAGEALLNAQAQVSALGSPGHDAVHRAERLARLIVSDIALYNGDAILAARSGDKPQPQQYDELEARLRVDLEEGRLLFDLRVPHAVRQLRDFIGDALRELVAKEQVA